MKTTKYKPNETKKFKNKTDTNNKTKCEIETGYEDDSKEKKNESIIISMDGITE